MWLAPVRGDRLMVSGVEPASEYLTDLLAGRAC